MSSRLRGQPAAVETFLAVHILDRKVRLVADIRDLAYEQV
jgi:hypothetical protein